MFVFDREKEQYVMRQQKEARNYFKDNQKRKVDKSDEQIIRSARESLQHFIKNKYGHLEPIPYELPQQLSQKKQLNVDVISIRDIQKLPYRKEKMLSSFPVKQEKQQFRQFLQQLDNDPYYQEAVMMFSYSLFKK